MIELIGIPGSHEYEVALAIREAFVAQWPGVDTSPAAEELVKIAANAKLAGYQVSDIDIIVAAIFNRPRHFVIRKPIKDKDGRSAGRCRPADPEDREEYHPDDPERTHCRASAGCQGEARLTWKAPPFPAHADLGRRPRPRQPRQEVERRRRPGLSRR